MLQAITGVFNEMSTWMISAIQSVTDLFYVDAELTVLGILAVMGLAVSLIFLLIGVVQNFLHLRG